MAQTTFTMRTAQKGRMKYILLTLLPPIALVFLLQQLMEAGHIPGGQWETYYVLGCTAVLAVLGHFLLGRKNHQISVNSNTVLVFNRRNKEVCHFKADRIATVRRNWLQELILLDKDGQQLLCVESNMTNFDQFVQWLEQHNQYSVRSVSNGKSHL